MKSNLGLMDFDELADYLGSTYEIED